MDSIVFRISARYFLFISLILLGCSGPDDQQNNTADLTLDLGFESILIFENNEALKDKKGALEKVIRETVAAVNAKMPVGNLKILVKVAPANVIPELGIGGFNPGENEIIISIAPNFNNLTASITNELSPMLAHEMHHAKRRRTVGYGTTLLEASVTEGLADCFAMEITGIDPPIWSVALSGEELEMWLANAREIWNTGTYNHGDWFFGNSTEIPRWAAYSIGFKLVKDYLKQNPLRKASDLFNETATSFVQ